MLGEYAHTKSESLAPIRAAVAELQHFFLEDCFLLAHPVLRLLYLLYTRDCSFPCAAYSQNALQRCRMLAWGAFRSH